MPTLNATDLAGKYLPKAEQRKKLVSSAWAHLANAEHIDRIIAHLKANPKLWITDIPTRCRAYEDAWAAAWESAYGLGRRTEWTASRLYAWHVGADLAVDAISALVAWDACGELMSYSPKKLHSVTTGSNPGALLLLPAVTILYPE